MNIPAHKKNKTKAIKPVAKNLKELYLDRQEVLQQFSVSVRTLQNWRDNRLISYSRIGNKIYYLRSDVESLMLKKRVKKEPEIKDLLHPFLLPVIIIAVYLVPLLPDLIVGKDITTLDLLAPLLWVGLATVLINIVWLVHRGFRKLLLRRSHNE